MRKVLFLEWQSFANDFLIVALQRYGKEVIKYSLNIHEENTRNSEKLATEIATQLMEGNYEFVISFNYLPVAAIACKACHVPYIAWVYDSPYVQMYSETIRFETNHVFVFDSAESERFEQKGIQTVNFLPMAADVEYYDRLLGEMDGTYDYDVSFVGSTYCEEYQQMYRHLKKLDPYTKGYLDAAMYAQKNVYGVNFMEKILTTDIIENMQKVCPVFGNGDGFETVEWTYARYFLDRKITSMERMEILERLSHQHNVTLFTPEQTPKLSKVHNKGKADYYTEAPRVFRKSKINLNITLKSIVNGIPLRVFDIMGCGGFLLTNYQPDLFQFFVPDEDFVFYEDQDDLERKVDYYLKHDTEREQIARNGYKKIKKFHSYDLRVEEMMSYIN